MEEAWGINRIDVPRAPGLGLLLDTVHFDKYNKRFAGDGMHEALDWVGQEDAVDRDMNKRQTLDFTVKLLEAISAEMAAIMFRSRCVQQISMCSTQLWHN